MPEIDVVRTALHEYVLEQARWRQEKVAEYPDDTRNSMSAACLRDLAAYVSALPDSDLRLMSLNDLGDYLIPDDVLMPGEDAARMLSRYGFDRPRQVFEPDWRPEASEFLDRWVEACQGEAGVFKLESLDEAATSEGALDALDDLRAAEEDTDG